jgi:hypothetical protein
MFRWKRINDIWSQSKMADKKINYPYPKGEHIWVGYYSDKHELMFITTSKDSSREYYFLYEYSKGKFKKLGKSRSPRELEEKFNVNMKMHGQRT